MLSCKSDINRRKHSENIRLNEGNQQFQAVQEDAEEHRNHRHASEKHASVFRHYEDDADHAEQLDVACQHIGKESDGEGDGLYEGAEKLDHSHDGLEESGHVRIDDFQIVMLCASEIYGEESEKREHQGAGDVSGKIGPSGEEGYDAQEIVQQDEEECHAEIWRIAAEILLADVFPRHIVHHHHQWHQDRTRQGCPACCCLHLCGGCTELTCHSHVLCDNPAWPSPRLRKNLINLQPKIKIDIQDFFNNGTETINS